MKKRPKKKTEPVTDAALIDCMAYLHGDVVDGELQAACDYEYARESDVLREAAQLHATGIRDPELYLQVDEKFRCGSWFMNPEWSFIWQCRSFPHRSWHQLSDKEHADIALVFPLPGHTITPLRMNEVGVLDASGVFDTLKEMVAMQLKEASPFDPTSTPPVLPIVEGWPKRQGKNEPWLHALFTIDFRKTKKRLRQEFEKWLDLPENKRRFETHSQKPMGKLGAFKDRLKDLAAWRLYRELGPKEAFAFSEVHRLRTKADRPRAFHDTRKGQAKEVARHEAPLFSEESGFQKAKARALAYLAELIPWEFGEYAAKRERERNELLDALIGELKISKSSS